MTVDTRTTAGVLLLTLVAVEWGGTVVLRVARGQMPATSFQEKFARAGHAHAAVLVILALVCQLYADAAHLTGLVNLVARDGVPAAAILFPLGSFLFVGGAGAHRTKRLDRPSVGRRRHLGGRGHHPRHWPAHRMTAGRGLGLFLKITPPFCVPHMQEKDAALMGWLAEAFL